MLRTLFNIVFATVTFTAIATQVAQANPVEDCAREVLCCEGDACGEALHACLKTNSGEDLSVEQRATRLCAVALQVQTLRAQGESCESNNTSGPDTWDN